MERKHGLGDGFVSEGSSTVIRTPVAGEAGQEDLVKTGHSIWETSLYTFCSVLPKTALKNEFLNLKILENSAKQEKSRQFGSCFVLNW